MHRNIKCYISAPFRIDTEILKNILSEEGISTFDAFDFSIGEEIQDLLKRKIREADFAVILLGKQKLNAFYEIGLCKGLGKPVLVITERKMDLPSFIKSNQHVVSSLVKAEYLKIAIKKFRNDFVIEKKKAHKLYGRTKISTAQKSDLSSLCEDIKKIRNIGNWSEFAHIVKNVFRIINIQIVEEKGKYKRAIDFAIWNENIGHVVGNPIFVELKYGTITTQLIKRSEAKLSDYLDKSDTATALFLYLDKKGRRIKANYSIRPLILRFDAEDFVCKLTKYSLEDVILQQRNIIVHGLSE